VKKVIHKLKMDRKLGFSFCPIPTPASSLNCLCSKELEEWESKTDTEADTNLSARLKPG
jgi:hypothetical protein